MKLILPAVSSEKWLNCFGDIFSFKSIHKNNSNIFERICHNAYTPNVHWANTFSIFEGLILYKWKKL